MSSICPNSPSRRRPEGGIFPDAGAGRGQLSSLSVSAWDIS